MTNLETALLTADTKDAQEAAREALIAAGTALAETLRSITLLEWVGTNLGGPQFGGWDEPENYQAWSADKVRPHLHSLVEGVAHTEKILNEIDAIRFHWEDRFTSFTLAQLVDLIGNDGRVEAEKIFARYGMDASFFQYRGLTVNTGGRTAEVRPVEPYRGAARAYFAALEAYADAEDVDRYERVISILRESIQRPGNAK